MMIPRYGIGLGKKGSAPAFSVSESSSDRKEQKHEDSAEQTALEISRFQFHSLAKNELQIFAGPHLMM